MTRVFRQLNELRELKQQTNDETDNLQSETVSALAQNVLLAGDIVWFEECQVLLLMAWSVSRQHAH